MFQLPRLDRSIEPILQEVSVNAGQSVAGLSGMEYAAGLYGPLITVIVGEEERHFLVYLSKLGPLRNLIDLTAGGEIRLPQDDPNMFELIADWTKGTPLPRINPGLEIEQEHDYDYELKIEPVAINEQPVLLAYTSDDKTQDQLFDIMLFAERHQWECLFNDAIDAYRQGEAMLNRPRPSWLHIERAYKNDGKNWAVRTFMADYVYATGKAKKNLSVYLMMGDHYKGLPGFIDDIFHRFDSRSPFRYPTFYSGGMGVVEEEAPLNLLATSYHIHNGQARLSCFEGYCAGWK